MADEEQVELQLGNKNQFREFNMIMFNLRCKFCRWKAGQAAQEADVRIPVLLSREKEE